MSEIYLNGRLLGKTENMHRAYFFDAKGFLKEGDNILRINISSAILYVLNMQAKNKVRGFNDWMKGFAHIRKPHYSFGWDWAPQASEWRLHKKHT